MTSQRTGQIHQLAGAGYIHVALFIQQAKHHAVRAQQSRLIDLFLHNFEFEIGVAKISAARANHDIKTDGDAAAHGGNHTRARCDSTFEKIGAEFNPLCPSAFSCNRRLHGIDADFKVHDDRVLFQKK